jgi:hypothetical protein
MKCWKQIGLLIGLLLVSGCNIFETRDTEPPTQSGSDFQPPTGPDIVISNLQSAVAQKNATNYIACFADPLRSAHAFRFIPSAGANAQYPGIFASWSYSDEQSYFQNLIARASPNGYSNLLLTQKSSVVSADSVVYTYDYTLSFDHTESGFPTTAQGNLQFSLAADNGSWSIYAWIDYKTTNDVTWSSFKGKFSN